MVEVMPVLFVFVSDFQDRQDDQGCKKQGSFPLNGRATASSP